MFRSKFTMITVFIALLLFITGCGSNQEENSSDGSNEELVPIDAKLEVPETAKVNETVTFSTHVTQGEENVEDANEVKYEVWKDGNKENSEMIESKHKEKGKYTAEKKFEEKGIYTIQVHVTARDMHTMPTTKINVGNVEPSAHEHEKEEGHHHGHGDEHQQVSINLIKPSEINVKEKAEWKVHLESKGQPLEEAEVRFEIIKDGVEKHEWVDLTSTAKAGEYAVQYAFSNDGQYQVKIHVTKGEDIHAHTVEMVEVK